MRVHRHLLAALLLLAAGAACGRDEPAAAQTLVRTEMRDSAGVTIVTNTGNRPAERWRLSAEPLVSMELDVGHDTLRQVAGAVRVRDGFVVANAATRQLRWYDAQGAFVRGLGRQGTAEGDFEYLVWMGRLPGDTIAAWDMEGPRISLFSPAKRFARAVTLDGIDGFPAPYGRLGDGTLVVGEGESELPPGTRLNQTWRAATTFFRVDPADGGIQELFTIPDLQMYARRWEEETGDDDLYAMPVPLGRQAWTAVGDSAFWVAAGDGYEIAKYRPDGTLAMLVRREHEPVPLTARDRADYRRLRMEWIADAPADLREDEREHLETAPYPAALQPYVGIWIDREGRLWVREADPPSAWDRGTRWSVFDREGRWIAAVDGPAYFIPRDIGPDWILGSHTDTDDTLRVRLYRIERVTGG